MAMESRANDIGKNEVSAGAAYFGGVVGPFIRGTHMFDNAGKFRVGIEAELFIGGDTELDGTVGSGALFLRGRYGSDRFGIHTRIGLRYVTFENENIQGLDLGLGADYKLDEELRHGIRADLGISGLTDLGGDNYYPIIGGAVLVQLGYSYRF